MYFTRFVGFYVANVYVPAFLIVVISWVSFWLDQDHHARVALGVTTVLTMTTLMSSNNEQLSKISSFKSLDIYLFVSFIMVFLSLIEYATVGYCDRRLRRQAEKRKLNQTDMELNETNIDTNSNGKEQKPNKLIITNTEKVDRWARWLFPGFFILFNISYAIIMYILSVIYHIKVSDD